MKLLGPFIIVVLAIISVVASVLCIHSHAFGHPTPTETLVSLVWLICWISGIAIAFRIRYFPLVRIAIVYTAMLSFSYLLWKRVWYLL